MVTSVEKKNSIAKEIKDALRDAQVRRGLLVLAITMILFFGTPIGMAVGVFAIKSGCRQLVNWKKAAAEWEMETKIAHQQKIMQEAAQIHSEIKIRQDAELQRSRDAQLIAIQNGMMLKK